MKLASLIALGLLTTFTVVGSAAQAPAAKAPAAKAPAAKAPANATQRFEVTSIKAVRPTLVRTVAALEKMGHKTIPSEANFIMFELGTPASPVIKAMKEKNVEVGRLFPAMPNHMRLTIGKKNEMEAFLAAFRQVLPA